MPYLNIHTPLDEIGRRRMADAVARLDEVKTIADLIEHLRRSFGEFQNAATEIEQRAGAPGSPIGRAVVGRGPGEVVEIVTPAGKMRCQIVARD